MSARTTTSARPRPQPHALGLHRDLDALRRQRRIPDRDDETSCRDVADLDDALDSRRALVTVPNETTAGSATTSSCAAARRSTSPAPDAAGSRSAAPSRRGAPEPDSPTSGRPCARIAATPAVTAAAALVPLTVPNRISPSSPRPGSDGHRHAWRGQIGLEPAVEREPTRRERRDRPAALALCDVDATDRDRHRHARGDQARISRTRPLSRPTTVRRPERRG